MSVPPIRVASVPADHVYVRHLTDPEVHDGVRRLPDPPVPGAPAGRWWPPVMLEPGWVAAHADGFDVFHLHFGFDDRTPAQLAELCRALRRAGKPLVLTVHDLRNPHHADPRPHAAALDVLVPAADEVLTLTPGAATEISRRWGRRARVLAHPHVVPLDRAARPRPPRGRFTVGLHAKPRANHDAVTVAQALVPLVAGLPGARLRVDVVDDEPGRSLARCLAELRVHPTVEVHAGPRPSDDVLWDRLAGLDVLVLPYRFGTHSGWLEACHDLGTAVLAPGVGFFTEQGPCEIYHRDGSGPEPRSLRAALHRVHDGPAPRPADPSWRAAQRRHLARRHADLYRRLCGVRAADDRRVDAR